MSSSYNFSSHSYQLEAEWFSHEVFGSKMQTERAWETCILHVRERGRHMPMTSPHCWVTRNIYPKNIEMKTKKRDKSKKPPVNQLFLFPTFKLFQDLSTDWQCVFSNVCIKLQIEDEVRSGKENKQCLCWSHRYRLLLVKLFYNFLHKWLRPSSAEAFIWKNTQ